MAEITSKDLVVEVCKALADKRGKDIIALYVREKTDLCDYFVIASGSNAPQIKASSWMRKMSLSVGQGLRSYRRRG